MNNAALLHTTAAAAPPAMPGGNLVTSMPVGASVVLLVIYLAVLVFYGVAMWRIYTKAGQPGWAAIIPFYNMWVLLKIVGRPGWWFVMLLIPFVNIVFMIIVYSDLSKSFGHDAGFTLGLIFLSFIFFPILAFGQSRYVGPSALQGVSPAGYPGYPGGYGGPPGGFAGPGPAPYGPAPYGPAPYGPAPYGGPPGGFPTADPFQPGNQPGMHPSPGVQAGPGAPPAAQKPDWYTDPSGRHQQRYWNGSLWTEHVADGGVQANDPL
ncbi:MAG: DUF5684 domain-containing protein [Acidimicrobiales bacterium]